MVAFPVRSQFFTSCLVVLLLSSLVVVGWCSRRIEMLNRDRMRLMEEIKRIDEQQKAMLPGLPGIESAKRGGLIQERGLWAPRSISF